MNVPRRDNPVFNNLPAVILVLGVLMVGTFAVGEISRPVLQTSFQLGAIVPAYVTDHPSPLGWWSPWLLHVFVHGGWLHLAFNTLALLAFGTASARPFGSSLKGQGGFLLFYFACALAGAGAHVALNPGSTIPMVGASTALSGCMAAAGWASGGWRGMLRLSAPWFVINVILAFVGTQMWIAIAWAGHLGGLLAGAALYPVFVSVFGTRRRV